MASYLGSKAYGLGQTLYNLGWSAFERSFPQKAQCVKGIYNKAADPTESERTSSEDEVSNGPSVSKDASWIMDIGERAGYITGTVFGGLIGGCVGFGRNFKWKNVEAIKIGEEWGAQISTFALCALGSMSGLAVNHAVSSELNVYQTAFLAGVGMVGANLVLGKQAKHAMRVVGAQAGKIKGIVINTFTGTIKDAKSSSQFAAHYGAKVGRFFCLLGAVTGGESAKSLASLVYPIERGKEQTLKIAQVIGQVAIPLMGAAILDTVFINFGLTSILIVASSISLSEKGFVYLGQKMKASNENKPYYKAAGVAFGYLLTVSSLGFGLVEGGAAGLIVRQSAQLTHQLATALMWNNCAIPVFAAQVGLELAYMVSKEVLNFARYNLPLTIVVGCIAFGIVSRYYPQKEEEKSNKGASQETQTETNTRRSKERRTGSGETKNRTRSKEPEREANSLRRAQSLNSLVEKDMPPIPLRRVRSANKLVENS